MKYIKNYILIKSNILPTRNILSLLSSVRFQSSSETSESERPVIIDDNEEDYPKKHVQRNKSGLLEQHRNILLGKKPYEEPQSWVHLTEKYQRKLYGKYGSESNINPRICFYTKEQKDEQLEYEKVAYPYTIQEMIETNKKEKEAKQQAIQKREDEIAKKIAKLEQWKIDLNAKIAKKESDALQAKQRKERLIEEVRRHFGFKIDARDERFKELLEQKEKEDRKKQKEAKKKAKEDKLMAKLIDTKDKNQQAKKNEENSINSKNNTVPDDK